MDTQKIEELFERQRISSRPKVWKFDINSKKEIDNLIWETVRDSIIKYTNKLKELGIINFNNLLPKEKKIIEERFLNRKSLEQVGMEFGITRERVRQIERIVLDKIKKL